MKIDDFHDKMELGHLEIMEDERKSTTTDSTKELVGSLDDLKFYKDKPKEAMRFTEGKLRFDLLPIEALIELTRVFDMGAIKYDDNNWRKGMKWSQVYRPIFSHLFKWLSGQEIDKETGCHHLAMVAWNALVLLTYSIRKLGTDDRTKFAIDDNFNWVDNHLGIGLPPEKIQELKDKYQKQRENHK